MLLLLLWNLFFFFYLVEKVHLKFQNHFNLNVINSRAGFKCPNSMFPFSERKLLSYFSSSFTLSPLWNHSHSALPLHSAYWPPPGFNVRPTSTLESVFQEPSTLGLLHPDLLSCLPCTVPILPLSVFLIPQLPGHPVLLEGPAELTEWGQTSILLCSFPLLSNSHFHFCEYPGITSSSTPSDLSRQDLFQLGHTHSQQMT